MPTESNGVLRFDINDPGDLAALIKTGLLWRGGPAAIEAGVEYLRQNPDAVNPMVPANVLAMLQPAEPAPGTPVEQPVEEPVKGPPVA